jgi:hypothetical protein
MTADWKIGRNAADWECDWKGDARFHLRLFRSLSITEKLKAVENMCETAEFFRRKAENRRRSEPMRTSTPDSSAHSPREATCW